MSIPATDITKTSSTTIDQQLDKLIKDVLPFTPYILRLRSPNGRSSYQHHPHYHYHWSLGTPLFAHEEQELQYMTFRQFPEGMLHSEGDWDDGKGAIPIPEKPPSQEGVKKKITLAD